MGTDEIRAADADRQAVADQLRAALDEGRLELHEYDERLQRAYAAKTYGELSALLADLPAAVPVPRRPDDGVPDADAVPAVVGSNAELTRRWLHEVWGSWGSAVGITSTIWLITCVAAQDLQYYWPVWVAGPWGAFLVYETVAGLINGEPRKQAEKRARKQHAKQLKRERRALEAVAEGESPGLEPKRDRQLG
jgi:hypothetical protein